MGFLGQLTTDDMNLLYKAKKLGIVLPLCLHDDEVRGRSLTIEQRDALWRLRKTVESMAL